MSFAIPLVFVSDAATPEDAVRAANCFANSNFCARLGTIVYTGDPVQFDGPDPENLDADEPDYHAVVEVRS